MKYARPGEATPPKARRGLTTTEVMVAVVLLAVAGLPLLRLLGMNRRDQGSAREQVRLQAAVVLVLDEAVADAGAGRWWGLTKKEPWSEERVTDGGWSPLATSLRVERAPDGLLVATARAESGSHFFELAEVLDAEEAP